MTDRELMQQALEALSPWAGEDANHTEQYAAYHAIGEALAEQTAQQWNAGVPSLYPEPEQGVSIKVEYEQPEFFTHNVEHPYDWSEWVCPDPKSYLMKCCDCGLVHEAQFGVVRYKSETEREDCEKVEDPNLQAVFRMRRSEQWSPKDTAYRPGGLAQPEQEPVAWMIWTHGPVLVFMSKDEANMEFDRLNHAYPEPTRMLVPLYTSPPASKPWVGLTDEEIAEDQRQSWVDKQAFESAAWWAEAKLREKNNG